MGVVDKLLGSSEEIVLYAKKNAPRLISIGSSILTVGACAGTGIATWKAKDKLEDHNIKLKVLHADLEAAEEDGTEEEVIEIKKDIMKEYGKTCLTIAGYYAVPAGLLAGSIACDIVSSKQYEHKLALASGSLFLLKSAWDKAQERAKEELGEEKAADIFYGGKEKEVETARQARETMVNSAKKYQSEQIPLAEARADQIIQHAQAVKSARIAEANGQTARFNNMFEEYKTYPLITKQRLYYEALEEILPDAKVIITDGTSEKLLPLDKF